MNSQRSLTRVASHILNRPLAITPSHAAMLVAALRSELNVKLLIDAEGMQLDGAGMQQLAAGGRAAADSRRGQRERKVYDQNGTTAVIPVLDTLTKRWGLEPYSGMTGYDGIKEKLMAALADDEVDSIYLDIDSPGGDVAGLFDLADLIHASNAKNGGKRIYAMADEMACSAAFAIGCAADELWTSRTGIVGSVGVIMIHAEMSQAFQEAGIGVTVIRAGAHKAEGNRFEPLSDDTLARFQAECDETRELFIDSVARYMGISKKSVRETEALTYSGQHARDMGFVKGIASAEQVWARIYRRQR